MNAFGPSPAEVCLRPAVSRRRLLSRSVAGAAAVFAAPAVLRAAAAKPYRAAVIGHTGRGDYGHGLDVVWRDVPQAQLVAVADPDPKGLAQAGKRLGVSNLYTDYRKMLEEVKPHLLSIGPRWIDRHCEYVVAAAQSGVKGIYLEKPLCRTLAEADAMVAACDKHRVKLAVAFQTRYSPKLRVIGELIASGKLGQVIEFRARGKEDSRGGAEDLWVLGPHLMDLMIHFAGPAKSVFGSVFQKGRPVRQEDARPGNEGIAHLAGDEVHAMYRLGSGVTAYFDSIKNAGGGPRFALWILGSQGVIEMGTNYLPFAFFLPHTSWSRPRAKKDWIPISTAGPGKPEPLEGAGPHDGNVAAVQDIIEAIETDRQPVAHLAGARAGLEMIVGVFASHLAGRPLPLPLAERGDPLAAAG